MKTLIFSDTHLGTKFDQKKFDILKRIITNSDQVIINGDFWEGFRIKFDDFINSQWKQLFPLLKLKNTIYIPGNHDNEKFSNDLTKLFSNVKVDSYTLVQNGKTFLIEHGDRLAPLVDKIIPLPAFMVTLLQLIESILMRFFGRPYINFIHGRFNKIIKKKVENSFKENEYLVCGHTHAADFDLKNHYINSGCFQNGLAEYVIIDNGEIKPMREKY